MFISSCHPTCQSYKTSAGEKKGEPSSRVHSLFSGISPLISLAPPMMQHNFDRVAMLPSSHCAMEMSLWFEIPSETDLLAFLFSDFSTYQALFGFYKNKEYEAFFGVLLSTCHTLKQAIINPLSPRRSDYKDIIYLYHLHQALKEKASRFFDKHVTPCIEDLLRDLTAQLTPSQKGRLVRCLNLLESEQDTSADELRSLLLPFLYATPNGATWLSNKRVLSEVISILTMEQFNHYLPEIQEAIQYCQELLNGIMNGREIQLPKFWVASEKTSLTIEEITEVLKSNAAQSTVSSPKETQLVFLLSSSIEWLHSASMKIDAASKLRLIIQNQSQHLLMPCIHAIALPNEDSLQQQRTYNQAQKLEVTYLSTSAVKLILEKLKPYVSSFTPLHHTQQSPPSHGVKRPAINLISAPAKRTKVNRNHQLFAIASSPPASEPSASPSSNGLNGHAHSPVLYTQHTLFVPQDPHQSIKELLEFCNQEDSKKGSDSWLKPPEGKKHLDPQQLLALDPGMRFKMYQSTFSVRRLLALAYKSPRIVQEAIKHGLFLSHQQKAITDENYNASRAKRDQLFLELKEKFKEVKSFAAQRKIWHNIIHIDTCSFNPFLFVNYSSIQNVLFDLSAEIIDELKLNLKNEIKLEIFFTNLAYRLIRSCKKKALKLYVRKGSINFLIDHNTFDWTKIGNNFRQFPNEPVLIYKLLEELNTDEMALLDINLSSTRFGQGDRQERSFLVLTLLKEMGAAIRNRYFLNPLPQINGFPRRISNLPLTRLIDGELKDTILADKNLGYLFSNKETAFTEKALIKIPEENK